MKCLQWVGKTSRDQRFSIISIATKWLKREEINSGVGTGVCKVSKIKNGGESADFKKY